MDLLITERLMPVAPAPVRDGPKRPREPPLGRAAADDRISLPRLCPDVGQAEEVEGRITIVASGALRSEVDKAGLGRVEHKPVPAKTLSQSVKHPPGVPFGLKRP